MVILLAMLSTWVYCKWSNALLVTQTSNLVLTAEQRRNAKEPDGTAQSLWGNLSGQMGDRVQQAKPEGVGKKSRRSDEGLEHGVKRPKVGLHVI